MGYEYILKKKSMASQMGNVCSMTFYVLINISTYLILNSINNDFYGDFSLIYHFFLIFFIFSSFYLLIKIKKGPGIIEPGSKSSLTLENSTLYNSETKSISLSNTPFVIPKSDLLIKQNCELCNISNLPLRSHHCKRCGICIRTFDHHCKFINTCIGEDNHIIFIFFLLTQNIAIILALYGLFKSISLFLINNKNSKYMDMPITVYILIIILVYFLIYCGILFFFHIYLISTNQTTYEIFHKEKNPYLFIFKIERQKILNERGIDVKPSYSFHPFDCGLIKNVKFYMNKLIKKKYKINWEEIFFDNLKTNEVHCNCCDNEYWSCF